MVARSSARLDRPPERYRSVARPSAWAPLLGGVLVAESGETGASRGRSRSGCSRWPRRTRPGSGRCPRWGVGRPGVSSRRCFLHLSAGGTSWRARCGADSGGSSGSPRWRRWALPGVAVSRTMVGAAAREEHPSRRTQRSNTSPTARQRSSFRRRRTVGTQGASVQRISTAFRSSPPTDLNATRDPFSTAAPPGTA